MFSKTLCFGFLCICSCLFFFYLSQIVRKRTVRNLIESRKVFNGRSRLNEAWHYLFQLLVWLCNDFFKRKHLFLIISLSKM